jgi:signal transduction histidine kinase
VTTSSSRGDTRELRGFYVTRAYLLRQQSLLILLGVRAIGGLAALLALQAFGVGLPPGEAQLGTLIALAIPLSSLALTAGLRSGRLGIAPAGHTLLALDTLLITAAVVALGGVRTGAPALFLWVIVSSALLFGSRVQALYTLVCGALTAGLLLLERTGLYAQLAGTPGLLEDMLRPTVLTVAAVLAALGTYLLVRTQERVAAESEQLNVQLERRIGAATVDLAEALRETKQLHDGLTASYAKLDRLQRFRDDMANMIVHDLKGPLSNISTTLGIIRLLLAEHGLAPDSEAAGLVAAAEQSAEQMARLIGNLLDAQRLEEGRLPVALGPTDLGAALRERCRQVGARLAQKQLVLDASIPDDLPAARADPALFARVLDNLLDNAIKYTPSGGHIAVSCRPEAAGLVVRVADSGPGIPASERERVFDKYEQLGGDRRRDSGAGLGLAFCRMAVQAQGGTIWVAPDDQGATFCVALERAG